MNGFLRKKISKLQIEPMAKCFVLPTVCTYLLLVIIRDEKPVCMFLLPYKWYFHVFWLITHYRHGHNLILLKMTNSMRFVKCNNLVDICLVFYVSVCSFLPCKIHNYYC